MNTTQIKFSKEGLISRIYGLFPYFEYGENSFSIKKATESNIGCYEKIIPNCILPVSFEGFDGFVLTKGKTYSYNFLIGIYNEYHVIPEFAETDFIKFIERGIGVKQTSLAEAGLDDGGVYELFPETIRMSLVGMFLEKMYRLKNLYETNLNSNYTDCSVCENGKKFLQYGGYKFIEYLKKLEIEANDIAEEYFYYASHDDVNVSFDIELTQSHFDLGLSNCYVNKWIPGEKYYCGDIVTYNGITYVCVLDRIFQNPCDEYYFIDEYGDNQYYNNSGTNCQYVNCDGIISELNSEGNGYDVLDPQPFRVENLELFIACNSCDDYPYIVCGDRYYQCNDGEYEEMDVCEYTTGVFNEATHTIEFDYAHFMPMTDYIQSYGNNNNQPTQDELDGWYCANNVYGVKYKTFVELDYIPDVFVCEYIRFLGVFYVWNNNEYVVDQNDCGIYKLDGNDRSSLVQFRVKDSFLDFGNNIIVPDFGNDFLYFYKIGKTVNNKVLYDENGNISRFGQSLITVGQYVYDLYAYGDVLLDIKVFPETREIKFYYILGAHLKAKCVDIGFNSLLEPIYLYDGAFEYDENDSHGVKYSETYTYDENGDLDGLIADGNFNYYVRHYNSNVVIKDIFYGSYVEQGVNLLYETQLPQQQIPGIVYVCMIDQNNAIAFYKWDGNVYSLYTGCQMYDYAANPMVFHTIDEEPYVKNVEVGMGCDTHEYTYINSEFNEDVENTLDLLYNPTYKQEYFNGIMYTNVQNTGIRVGRGNAASIERHVKLGDIKTIEDLENYQNNGFFNIRTD